MNFTLFILPLAVVALLATPFIPVYKRITTGKAIKRTFIVNFSMFFGICLLGVIIPFGGFMSAADTAANAVNSAAGLGYLSAALSTGMSGIGAGIAVAAAAPAAIGAFSENPKSFGKALIFVVLGEGIALYGLLLSILIINSIG